MRRAPRLLRDCGHGRAEGADVVGVDDNGGARERHADDPGVRHEAGGELAWLVGDHAQLVRPVVDQFANRVEVALGQAVDPCPSRARASASRSTSSSTWLETTTVRPVSPSSVNRSIMWRRWRGSRPSSGSSSTTICGFVDERRRQPSRAGACPWSRCGRAACRRGRARPSRGRVRAAASASSRPSTTPRSASRTRRPISTSGTTSCCGTSPRWRNTSTGPRGSSPSRRTVPRDGAARPHSMRITVDLPAPLGPEQRGDAGADREADVADRDDTAEELRNAVELDDRRRSSRHPQARCSGTTRGRSPPTVQKAVAGGEGRQSESRSSRR